MVTGAKQGLKCLAAKVGEGRRGNTCLRSRGTMRAEPPLQVGAPCPASQGIAPTRDVEPVAWPHALCCSQCCS